MSIRRTAAALGASALLAGLVPAASASAATPSAGTLPHLPQTASAHKASAWLAGQFNAQGFIPGASGPTQPDLSATAQSVLALAGDHSHLSTAHAGLTYLMGQVDAYVTVDGSDGPAQLALLILDAESLGADPTDFGGTNLVSRLLATEEATGPQAGLFGTKAQVHDYAAGTYEQGLALAALAAAGVTGAALPGATVSWLTHQQCPDGGWSLPDKSADHCSGSPANFAGPDTNSTSLAVQGLAAQGALTASVTNRALGFLTAAEDPDAGWSYEPSTPSAPQSTDPDSTALVIQALVALGSSPTGPTFTKASANPVSALLSFQLTSGSGAGAFYFPPAPAPASTIATYQAVPALLGLAFPFPGSGGPR